MKKYVLILSILYSNQVLSESLSSTVTFSAEEIIDQKVSKVNQQNQMGTTPKVTVSLFKSSETSNGLNLSSVAKTQQVGLDLHSEAQQLMNEVIKEQSTSGVSDPQGCANSSILTPYQNNVCLAAFTLQTMGIQAINEQSKFKETADRSYETMEDVSAFPLDNSNSTAFAADSNGLPTQTNILYVPNKGAIESFHRLYKSLDETSEYQGFKYNTQSDYFYLDGKKYPTSVMLSKDAMIKAGISRSLANFVYKMLNKKAKSAQNKIVSLLKEKKFYDGKKWSLIKYNGRFEEPQSLTAISDNPGEVPSYRGVDSSSLVEEKTLYKDVDGMQLGLSSDNIFKIISRKYREKDRLDYFHNSLKK